MWNKFKSRDRIYYSTRLKYRYIEYTPDMLDLLNAENSDLNDMSLRIFPQVISQELKSEFKELPPGIYRFDPDEYDPDKLYLLNLNNREECLDFKYIKDIVNDFNHWQKHETVSKKLKILHKRGILLYGPPGTGKTSTIHKIVTEIRPQNSIVIFCPKMFDFSILDALKHDSRLKIFVFEELTEVAKPSCIKQMLDFLDGECSLNNMFVLASTNYPESLPSNLVNRPGRFDRLYKVGYLTSDDVAKYFKFFLQREITGEELELFNKTTIAELKEVLLLVLRDTLSLDEAVQRINRQGQLVQEDFRDKNKVGFNDDNYEEGIL